MNCILKNEGIKPLFCVKCAGCGWDEAEAARRNEMVKNEELTVGKDGLKRLVIKRRTEDG